MITNWKYRFNLIKNKIICDEEILSLLTCFLIFYFLPSSFSSFLPSFLNIFYYSTHHLRLSLAYSYRAGNSISQSPKCTSVTPLAPGEYDWQCYVWLFSISLMVGPWPWGSVFSFFPFGWKWPLFGRSSWMESNIPSTIGIFCTCGI